MDDLVGEFRGEFIGPGWLRAVGPAPMRLGRMPGWCGKRFDRSERATRPLVRREPGAQAGAVVSDSVPMVADDRPLPDRRPSRRSSIGYPIDAPFPWPRVTDELRPFGERRLLGMTFGIPLTPPGGTPFLLRRTP